VGITYLVWGLVEGGVIVRRRERELRGALKEAKRRRRIQRKQEKRKAKLERKERKPDQKEPPLRAVE
jgi:hypothetical protein